MLRYAWFATQFTDEMEALINVNKVCFPIDVLKNPCDCKNTAFIRYTQCRFTYCFTCFYDKYYPTVYTVAYTSTTDREQTLI